MNKGSEKNASELDCFFGNDTASNGKEKEQDRKKNFGNEEKEGTSKRVTDNTEATENIGKRVFDWGNVTEDEVFARRSSLTRSPPPQRYLEVKTDNSGKATQSKGREGTETYDMFKRLFNNEKEGEKATSCIVIEEGEEKHRDAKKRKADTSPKITGEKVADDSKFLKEMQDKISELENFAKKNRNVHREIKQMAVDMKALIFKIKNEFRNSQAKRRQLEKDLETERHKVTQIRESSGQGKPERSESIREQGAITRQRKMRSVSTQADAEEIAKEIEEKTNRIEELKETILKGKEYKDIEKWLDIEWPEEMFKHTQKISWRTMDLHTRADMAVVIDPEEADEKGQLRQIVRNYPQFKGLISEKPRYGECEYIINRSSITTSRGLIHEERTQFFMALPYKTSSEGVNDMEGIYNLAMRMKEVMKQNNREEVRIILQKGIDREYTRKILEFVLKEQNIKAELMVEREEEKTQKMDGRVTAKEKKYKDNKRNNGIVIKSGSKTFAELLRDVKDSVDIEKMGVQIKTIKKTAKGDLFLKVVGEEENANKLTAAVQEKVKDVRVISAQKERTLIILDIDAITSQEEVLTALRTRLAIPPEEHITLKGLRVNRAGNKAATIVLRKETADKLKKIGRIRIGWVNCRIKERETLKRCYRCLEYGHETARCTGQDRSRCCLKCGEEGHKVSECRNAEKCCKCQVDGHRIDSTKCPAYKAYIQKGHGDGVVRNKKHEHQSSTNKPK